MRFNSTISSFWRLVLAVPLFFLTLWLLAVFIPKLEHLAYAFRFMLLAGEAWYDTASWWDVHEHRHSISALCVFGLLPICLATVIIAPFTRRLCTASPAARMHGYRSDVQSLRARFQWFLDWLSSFWISVAIENLLRVKTKEIDATHIISVRLGEFIIVRRIGSVTAA